MEQLGFLFDNDGVLMDTQEFHWKAWQWLMREESHFLMDEKQFISGFGKRNDIIIREILPGISQEELDRIAMKKEELFRRAARENLKLLPGMEDFLKELKKANVPRIICSSTPIENLKMFLESSVLGNYFDQFVSSEEVAKGKPAPDVFLEGARRIGLSPEKCIVVEDAPVGIVGGKKAGCFVVALATTHTKERLEETRCDVIFSSPKELHLREIEEIFSKRKK